MRFCPFHFPRIPIMPVEKRREQGNSHPPSSARSWRPETWWNRSFPRFSIGTTGFESFTLTRESHRISSDLTESHRISRIPRIHRNPKESDGGEATGGRIGVRLASSVVVVMVQSPRHPQYRILKSGQCPSKSLMDLSSRHFSN